MQKKKIALVYDAIYPFIMGGGERRFYEFGKRLAAEGHEVHLYGMKLWEGPATIKRDGLILHGISKARPLYTDDGRRSIFQALCFGVSAFKLLGQKFDIIDCCGFPYFSLFPCKLAAFLRGKPLYATWHEVWGKAYWQEYLGKILGRIGFSIERFCSRVPNTLIASSEFTAARLKEELSVRRPITVIPNGIDLVKIASLPAAETPSDVMYAGRLLEYKNVGLLVRALAQLKKNGKPVRCTIIGEGPEEKPLKKLAKSLDVEECINWLGFIEKSDDVYAHMKASRLFVLPSRREGFGIVVLEANACGIPVLTLDHPENAARQLINKGKNGHIFQHKVESLAESISHSLATEKEWMTKECTEIAKDFDWKKLGSQLMEVYAG